MFRCVAFAAFQAVLSAFSISLSLSVVLLFRCLGVWVSVSVAQFSIILHTNVIFTSIISNNKLTHFLKVMAMTNGSRFVARNVLHYIHYIYDVIVVRLSLSYCYLSLFSIYIFHTHFVVFVVVVVTVAPALLQVESVTATTLLTNIPKIATLLLYHHDR